MRLGTDPNDSTGCGTDDLSGRSERHHGERGMLLIPVLAIVMSIALFALLTSSRAVSATKEQQTLEAETRAYLDAYAQLEAAMNVVFASPYEEGVNVELADAVAAGSGDDSASEPWLRDPPGVTHGLIRGTDVRAYAATDYVRRLAALRGEEPPEALDDAEAPHQYVLESIGRSGRIVRAVSALIREDEPFSAYVLFQNRHPLGVSGAPRGNIHANREVAFYFPGGHFEDRVTASGGFRYEMQATPDNTTVLQGKPDAAPIRLEDVDFDRLRAAATFRGTPGLDAEVHFFPDGRIRIQEYTPPRPVTLETTVAVRRLLGFAGTAAADADGLGAGGSTGIGAGGISASVDASFGLPAPSPRSGAGTAVGDGDAAATPVYLPRAVTRTVSTLLGPRRVRRTWLDGRKTGLIFIEGRILGLRGDVNGRVTVVGNETVNVTGSIRYVDDAGRTAMLHGASPDEPYTRNPRYRGHSVLGVIARDDIRMTAAMPDHAEINAVLMAVHGRVGIDGFKIDPDGTPRPDPLLGLSIEAQRREIAYQIYLGWPRHFLKESLRKLGGTISNDRILETYVRRRGDGTVRVDAGFRNGMMTYDVGLAHGPPPLFPAVARPSVVATSPTLARRERE